MMNSDTDKFRLPITAMLSLIRMALVAVGLWGSVAIAQSGAPDDTMLMFVGEDIEVLTIASRREESAWQAPAVADVITRKEIRSQGLDTLSQALETVPGFYMAEKEWGTRPFLRGIPDSVLLLYDTVPLTSDVSKSIHPFDRELSLSAVKRIEIIRGPGSVLWGPDAFAGIVNVVPMTGKDLDGAETGAHYGFPQNGYQDAYGGYFNYGHDAGLWNLFFSFSGYAENPNDETCRIVRFWENGETPVPPEERMGEGHPDSDQFIEAFLRFAYGDWFTLSGRLSDNRNGYTMTSSAENLTWCERRDKPKGFVKVEAKKEIDHLSQLRWTGSFSRMAVDHLIIDRTLSQTESTLYGEMIYDRAFFARTGLFTAGVSYREKTVKDAPVWDGYLPGYLEEENPLFVPFIDFEDYNTQLWSIFGQYSQKFGDFEVWLGLRQDLHDSFEDHLTFNTGLSWSPAEEWLVKLLYGTAYRTPFAKQLREDESPELENIQNVSLQTIWQPSERWKFAVCGFWNRIEDHVMEDPYAGLSLPNHQEFVGVELEGAYAPIRSLELSANLTLMENAGPDEAYRLLVDASVDSEGNVIKVFENLNYPYDSGAENLFNFMVKWRPVERVSTHLRIGYTGASQLIHPRGEMFLSSSGVWTADVNAVVKDLFSEGLDMELSVKNLTDQRYEVPGTYSTFDGEGIRAEIEIRKRW